MNDSRRKYAEKLDLARIPNRKWGIYPEHDPVLRAYLESKIAGFERDITEWTKRARPEYIATATENRDEFRALLDQLNALANWRRP